MISLLQKLFSILILTAPGLSTPVQQAPLQLTCDLDAGIIASDGLTRVDEYGYQGPGVYYIRSIADDFNLVAGETQTGEGAPIVTWKANDTNTQRWYFSDVRDGWVMAMNNATGRLLSAAASRTPSSAYCSSPGKLEAHWRLDNYSSSGPPTKMVRFTNGKYTNEILAVYNRIRNTNGTAVYTWPIIGQNLNEAWMLEYLGPL